MRTKNLNLKKKIAFIASVAMIATTAAYLPAEVFTTSAAEVVTSTYDKTVATDKTMAAIKAAAKAAEANVTAPDATINTFNTFVKVNGKYLAVNADGEYKYFNTVSAAESADYKPVEAFKNVKFADTNKPKVKATADGTVADATAVQFGGYWDSTGGTAQSGNAYSYDDLSIANKGDVVLALPYISDANATIELEFVSKTNTTFTKDSLTTLELTLDDNGYAVVPANTKKIKCISNNSTYDSENGYYEEAKLPTKVAADAGTDNVYEEVDLSDLMVKVSPLADANIKSKTASTAANVFAGFVKVGDNTDATEYDADKTYPDTFQVKKVNGVYATVLKGQLDATHEVQPGDSIDVTTGFYTNGWTISGSGLKNDGAKLTLVMGNNGYAESGLIKATKGDSTEYYVFVLKNAAPASQADEKNIKWGGNLAGVAVDGKTLDTTPANQTGRVKVESETKVYNFQDKVLAEASATDHFVTEYTIYNNEMEADYTDGQVITINVPAGGSKTFALVDEIKSGTTATASLTSGDTTLTTTANDTTTNTGTTFTVKKSDAGTAESAIIQYKDGTNAVSYFKLKFTNKYEVKYSDDNKATHPGKNYDGKVKVEGTDVAAMADAVKPGFTFKSWNIDDGTGAPSADEIYSVAGGNVQITTDTGKINPNMKVVANYEGQKYSIALHAGNGYISTVPGTASKTEFVTYDGTQLPKTVEYTNVAKLTNDIAKLDAVKATRVGYDFRGWATTENAKEAMDQDDLDAAFPGDGQTLDLYPVYKAHENISVLFRTFAYNANTGIVMDTDGKIEKVDSNAPAGNTKYDNWKDGIAASFTRAADSTKTVVAGDKLGTLPTPVKKGYEFDGWYAKTINPITKVITAQKVTEDTTVDEVILDRDDNADNATGKLTGLDQVELYAKFIPKQYNITFDLGEGAWQIADYDKDTSDKPASYKYFDDKFEIYNAKGTVLYSNTVNPVANTKFLTAAGCDPKVGGGQIKEFAGWTINDGTTKYKTDKLFDAIDSLSTASDLTIKANYKNAASYTTAFNITVDANGGGIFNATFDATTGKITKLDDKDDNAAVAGDIDLKNLETVKQLKAGSATAGSNVKAVWTIKDNEFKSVSTPTDGFVVSRAGYSFTGWYSDKECTKPYTFGTFPAAGSEDVVYAGWKENTATRYWVNFDLYDPDGALVENVPFTGGNDGFQYKKTFTGKTGEVADVKTKTITVTSGSGTFQTTKKYVYDAALSKGLKTEEEIEATYKTSELLAGNFVEDSDNYIDVYGRFVEEGYQPSAELGKATNVKVSDAGKVTFTAADNAVKYQVCKIVDGKKYYSAKTDATTINITPAKKDYQVYVIAFDENGKSTHSATVKVTVKATSTLGTVQNPKVTESLEGDKKIGTVTWDKVEGATWYKVFKVVNGKTYWGSKVTENKYVFKNLPKDSSYIIYVAAGDDNGNVTYGARTKISKYPAVQNVKISADKKTVTFDKAEGAVNYQVAKLINGKTYYGTKSTSNSITMENAAKSGTQIFVLAFFTGEDGKTYSSYSQSITVE